jgi:glycine/D-amino acid oxidase-like deaminating enzyme
MTQLSAPRIIKTDICVIGGGVAGLWFANLAKAKGFDLLLLDTQALGSGQTIASQGMIHGGMKYTLTGALTGASEAIAEMPAYWRRCLCGEGDVSLRDTRILSDHFFLWSGETLSSKLTTFFASKLTKGRVTAVDPERRPAFLRHPDFTGSLYKLDDLVLDVPSLIANLAHNLEGRCFVISDYQLQKTTDDTYCLRANSLEIHAQQFVLCGGEGNQDLLNQLGFAKPEQQLRPLQQVMIKHHYPYDFFGHCVGMDTTPRLTISSHHLPNGEGILYLGGKLAEKGAGLSAEDLIELAKSELTELIPWMNLEKASWATFNINRAEPKQPGLARPDNAFAESLPKTNIAIAWPTKLTLAPNMANQLLSLLEAKKLQPLFINRKADLHSLTPAGVAKTPWEIAFPPPEPVEDTLAKRFKEEDEDD